MPAYKAAVLALGLAVGVLSAAKTFAQNAGQTVEREGSAAKQRILADLLAKALAPSRLPEIYADVRRSVREVYLPTIRATLQDGIPGQPAPEPDDADKLAKLATFLDYALRASDELAPVLADSRDAIIRDVAGLLANYFTKAEIDVLAELLDMPAMRKLFNTVYASTRLLTDYNYEEIRSYYALTAWLAELQFDLQDNPFTQPDAPAPSPEKVAKAQSIVGDLLRVSRLDEMVADILRFAKEVKLDSSLVPEGERDNVREGIEQGEFFYNLQKSLVLSVGPSLLAATLTGDQLDKLHLLVLSPVVAKSFGLLHEVVRSATAFSKADIAGFDALSNRAKNDGLFEERSPEADAQLEAEAKALGEKWRERLFASLKPETREGLERAIAALEAMKREQTEEDGIQKERTPGQRQL